jgi:histidine phosphotransferase ChpT
MSGTLRALRLIERTSARLCHDLRRAVCGLDQALQAPVERDAAIAEATGAVTSQLNLRQAAWGLNDQPISLHALGILAQGLPQDIVVDLSALPPGVVFPAALGRIVLNILLLAADSLPLGGRVILVGESEDLFVGIDGPSAAWPAGTALCLANEAEAQSALADGRDLQMAVTALLAHAAGIRLSALLAPTTQQEPAILRLGR